MSGVGTEPTTYEAFTRKAEEARTYRKESKTFFVALKFMPMFNFVIAESSSFVDQSSGSIGINYGQVANDLPAPTKVVNLLKTQEFTRVKTLIRLIILNREKSELQLDS